MYIHYSAFPAAHRHAYFLSCVVTTVCLPQLADDFSMGGQALWLGGGIIFGEVPIFTLSKMPSTWMSLPYHADGFPAQVLIRLDCSSV